MGLLDNVLGSMFGGGGGTQQGGASSSMSPMVKALLMLLAAKAVSSQFSRGSSAPAGTAPQPAPGGGGQMTSGMLAGLPGLDAILDKLKGAGHGDAVQSWIGHSSNKPVAPGELEHALGPDTVDALQKESGLPRDQLMGQVSTFLPQVVDKLTPDGHLPPTDSRGHW